MSYKGQRVTSSWHATQTTKKNDVRTIIDWGAGSIPASELQATEKAIWRTHLYQVIIKNDFGVVIPHNGKSVN